MSVPPETSNNPGAASVHAVTGAFGYSGKYIALRLLQQGKQVITLTNSTGRASGLNDRIKALPFNFDQPGSSETLAHALQGVEVLYNTYWVRFNHRSFTHADAVRNTLILFEAAQKAGVKRLVHISITNPSETSPLEYFSSKAHLERALRESGLSYAILRPTVLFGKEDILINNIAWALRHLPIFGLFGDGQYRLQPIYVDDLAALCVQQGALRENITLNAIGPETFTYKGMVEEIARLIGVRRLVLPMPPALGYLAASLIGALVNDVMITRAEIEGLSAGLLCVDTPPTGATPLTAWIRTHADTLGRTYTSELARRRDRDRAYQSN